MNIELRHLRYFVAVAEELHFGRAAARLNISQPPLSQQIQILEQQVGARLLARTNRSVSLTAAGKQFLNDSRQILSMVEDAAAQQTALSRGSRRAADRVYLVGTVYQCRLGDPFVIPPPFPGCSYSDARDQYPRADCAAE